MDGGGGAGGDVSGGERWAPSGRQLTASLVGLNVFVVLLIYYYLWRFFSGKSDGGVPGGGGGGDDEDAESSAAPSRAVSPKARDREAMELAITALPVFVVHVPTPSDNSGDGGGGAGDAAAADANGGGGGGGKVLECAICIAEFADGEEGRLLPRCGHRFHARCVDMWFQLHSTCPLCRAGVLPPAPALPCPTTAPHDDDGQQQVVAPPPDHTDDTNRTDNCPV
uniref:RING-type E3 ubiquitin transferase n=1 Tax=Oryza nivara TaxID=4536 RepID=A0A0E0HDC1_ORYNI